MSSSKTKTGAEASAVENHAAREAWGLLAGLVYPPPLVPVARQLGLRPGTFGALRMLDKPRTMSEVANFLHCDNSNVTGIVDVLEQRGLATREPSATDRRVKLIALTAEGRRVRTRLVRAMAKPPAWVESLSAADQRVLRDLLKRASNATG